MLTVFLETTRSCHQSNLDHHLNHINYISRYFHRCYIFIILSHINKPLLLTIYLHTKIGEMGIVNLMLLYVTSLIGYYGLYRFSTIYGFYFEDVTNSFLFLLQTITFDAWGDIARAAMLTVTIITIILKYSL